MSLWCRIGLHKWADWRTFAYRVTRPLTDQHRMCMRCGEREVRTVDVFGHPR